MMRYPILAVAALATLVSPAALSAATADQVSVRAVQFSDLDLETQTGRATLERRLTRAVKSICSTNPIMESSAVRAERQACETATSAQLQQQVADAVTANRTRKMAMAYAGR